LRKSYQKFKGINLPTIKHFQDDSTYFDSRD
jgi:hypothetical protein